MRGDDVDGGPFMRNPMTVVVSGHRLVASPADSYGASWLRPCILAWFFHRPIGRRVSPRQSLFDLFVGLWRRLARVEPNHVDLAPGATWRASMTVIPDRRPDQAHANPAIGQSLRGAHAEHAEADLVGRDQGREGRAMGDVGI